MAAKWKKIVGALAPAIGAVLGKPLGGVGLAILAKSLGLDEGATEEDIATRVENLTSEDVAKMHAADMEYKQTLSDNEVEEFRISTADRQDARTANRAAEDWTPRALALIIIPSFVAILFTMIFFGQRIDPKSHDVLMLMTGSLGTISTGIMAYYFGTSMGSKKKTEIMSRMNGNSK